MRNLLLALSLLFAAPFTHAEQIKGIHVGVARVDITPAQPIRLNGYGNRTKPSDGVAQNLWARALAIGDERPVLFITADLVGVPKSIPDEVAARLARKMPFARDQLALCVTHTHTGPTVKGVLENIFMAPIPENELRIITEYTSQLIDKLEQVALAALKNRHSGALAWGVGKADFAINRRVLKDGKWTGFGETPTGVVDHSLPLLKVTDANGKTLALLVNYACHCTTLGGNYNHIHGDWAGRAAELLESEHKGVTAMIAIGCGADANPKNRGKFESIEPHARQVAAEVNRLLGTSLKPIRSSPQTTLRTIDLPFDSLPTRADWAKLANSNQRYSYYGKKMLARLERGETIAKSFPYTIASWTFGDDLAMVFLAGEVVADYSTRLKTMFDSKRLWINAYANDVPCYIASRRLYDEGGYEVDRSMWYYGKPTRLSKDTEELVIDEVTRQLPHRFYSAETLKQMPAPVTKEEALKTIRVRPGMKVELVAAEPLVMDPVDVAWGPDGRMWVVEMTDYPNGINDDGTPGGRVRFLEDTDGDGLYDKSTLFAEKLNFPNSVLPWRKGVLICAAPDILYAEDTNGDGKADKFEKILTGFGEGNQQHRVNGLQWGLDNWIYSANGDSNGKIRSLKTGKVVDINGRDFRFRPDTGEIETEAGRTQYGRSRDDTGNWFGSNNSNPGWHYALDERYLRRNPHVITPGQKVALPKVASVGPVFPISKTLSRFNDYNAANRFTSACGLSIYRDEFLGKGYYGNSFICEPVHNLVRREVVTPTGVTFSSRQPDDEIGTEFFASTDNWSRPTFARTGPDGALYIVDMYRQAIEHPQWIPQDWQRKLNLRDGHDKGRIYRIAPIDKPRRLVPRLDRLNSRELVAALESPSGWQRDTVQQLVIERRDKTAIPILKKLITDSRQPLARMQALCVLDGLNAVDEAILAIALKDSHAAVRRHAIRLSEPLLDRSESLFDQVVSLENDSDAMVRLQVAYSLGESKAAAAAAALARIAMRAANDTYLRAAAFSSANGKTPSMLAELRKAGEPLPDAVLVPLLQTALGNGAQSVVAELIDWHVGEAANPSLNSRLEYLSLILFETERRNQPLRALYTKANAELRLAIENTRTTFAAADQLARDASAATPSRLKTLQLLGHGLDDSATTLPLLTGLLAPTAPVALQIAALDSLARLHTGEYPKTVFARWRTLGPAVRGHALGQLLKRRDWSAKLLATAATDASLRSAFNPAQRAGLIRHRDAGLRKLAVDLFSKNISSNRQAVVDQFKSALALSGDADKGAILFNTLCAVCHQVGVIGKPVGPNITALTDRSKPTLLAAILDPNRAVEDKFVSYTADLKDDSSISGMITEETATSVTIQAADGVAHSILRSQLQSFSSSGLSLMPEGIEAGLNVPGMADLLAFLETAGRPKYIEAEKDGSISLRATESQPTGPSLVLDSASGALSWITEADKVEWTVRRIAPGYYDVFADASVAVNYDGKPFKLTIGDIEAEGTIEVTGALNRFRRRKFGNIRIPARLNRATIRLTHSLKGPQLALRELVLIPVK